GCVLVCGFFFSSRRRHTRLVSDWSSDVCSSDLPSRNGIFPTGSPLGAKIPFRDGSLTVVGVVDQARLYNVHQDGRPQLYVRAERSEERRVGKEWRYRRGPQQYEKKEIVNDSATM